jgi:hypothetical protein
MGHLRICTGFCERIAVNQLLAFLLNGFSRLLLGSTIYLLDSTADRCLDEAQPAHIRNVNGLPLHIIDVLSRS